VNIPLQASGYSELRDCKESRESCVVKKIDDFRAQLVNRRATLTARREALMFLVHFVGDIHQPFHAVLEERGANGIKVTLFGSQHCARSGCNLHAVWDEGLISHYHLAQAEYISLLEMVVINNHLQKSDAGNPAQWANESLAIARPFWVQTNSAIGDSYYRRAMPVVNVRLALAGLRLARILNSAFEE